MVVVVVVVVAADAIAVADVVVVDDDDDDNKLDAIPSDCVEHGGVVVPTVCKNEKKNVLIDPRDK